MNSAPNPTQQQLSDLIKQLKNGRFNEAEKTAISITKDFPYNQFAWKALWVALQKTKKISESLAAIQRCVKLSPKDAKAHAHSMDKQSQYSECIA